MATQTTIPQSQQILARAFAAHQAGNVAQAEFLYKMVLQADRKQFDALHMLGLIEAQRGNFAAGLARIQDALRVRPNALEALINLGRIQSELGDQAAAVATYKKALAADPKSALAHSNLSILLRKEGQSEEALRHCDAALAAFPNYADAHSNRGNALRDLERHEEALTAYNKAVALAPNHASAHLGRGLVFKALERPDDALAAYDRAVANDPNLLEAWLARGNLLSDFGRDDEALACFERARQLRPDSAEAWLECGNSLLFLRRHDEALVAYDRALALMPDLPAALLGRANVFVEYRRFAEAFASYDKALNLDPELAWRFAAGHRLFAKLNICDWNELDADVTYLLSALREGKPVSYPFPILSLPSTPADQLRCAKLAVADLPPARPVWNGEVYAHDRIRVAYLSSDLREHAVAYLTAGLFEHHDKSRFETTAISFDAGGRDSGIGRRIRAAFDRFIEAPSQTDQEIAGLIRHLEIDIVVDLNGFTRNSRLGVFTRRPAPIQVNYLGYAGTMGADVYDYIVADATVIPQEHFEFYSEKIVHLPGAFMANDDKRAVAERRPSRAELQLPQNGFVFCSFNQPYKIEPIMFDVWMRLLKAIDGSVLWLKDNGSTATGNLRLEAERRGVAPERLVFAPSLPDIADHLARQGCADLFLDTLHYNAHTTASDALWTGVPVLTCLGRAFAGRVAASLVRAVGLPELVTQSLADYEALALKLAREPALLAATRTKLAENRKTFPLFDTGRFTHDIEAAYITMWQRLRRGEPPESFAVLRE
ncbi:MAG TPA: tetratricopeptide repeat protein [Xanthobacteraceae bacterium]|nr:tetratricopeptide repeat protein [Xanthobacteraceae bacterium]